MILILLVTMKHDEPSALAALQPAHNTAPPGHIVSWLCKPTSLPQEYDDQHAANPNGHRYAVDNGYVRNDADVVSVLERAFTDLPSRQSFTLWYAMNPASRFTVADGRMPDMALSMQSDHYFATYSVWGDEKDDERCQGWVRQIFEEVAPHLEGSYLGDADFQVRNTRFWGEEQGRRLMEIRRVWDPKGVVAGYLDEGDRSGAEGIPNLL